MTKKNYIAILEKLQSEMDNLIKEYKITKQNIIKKLKIKENFWQEKILWYFRRDLPKPKEKRRANLYFDIWIKAFDSRYWGCYFGCTTFKRIFGKY